MRILLAEDDRITRRLLETVLPRWGYGVEVACDGNSAWEAVNKPEAPRLLVDPRCGRQENEICVAVL